MFDSQLADRLLHHQGESPARVAAVRDRRIDACSALARRSRQFNCEAAILEGECVLFVGAGLSRGAGLPDWGH